VRETLKVLASLRPAFGASFGVSFCGIRMLHSQSPRNLLKKPYRHPPGATRAFKIIGKQGGGRLPCAQPLYLGAVPSGALMAIVVAHRSAVSRWAYHGTTLIVVGRLRIVFRQFSALVLPDISVFIRVSGGRKLT
jgi:hypothetical protein